ncbi:sensor histidine kinase [Alteromonas lipolytica]|uniref:histidine kinase n=1 Tax=Alteromonas lipolytica TaxID=1856405 RepID=A0A1E8FGR9_9ALTE|nr:HAMP domain-containing sensor histidine kinase [Alteromonas lipolytica]OFI35130.1 ATPase [Alteromonas lipolytica]GGF56937.1 sensor histidine kinase [Alteromonas lipolytica]
MTTRSEDSSNIALSDDAQFDFSTVLAAAVHDMKNSLNLLVQSVEQIVASLPPELTETRNQIVDLHYEANRMNTGLVQILSLYRAKRDNLPVMIDQCFIDELLEDIVASNQMYAAQKNIAINNQCHEELAWYLDADLMYLLINDVLINALRYGKSDIIINAYQQDGLLVVKIEDDGAGYPEHMLVNVDTKPSDFNVTQGRTGLGLYFAHLIARAHTQNDKKGFISLSNGGALGGGVFEVKIP